MTQAKSRRLQRPACLPENCDTPSPHGQNKHRLRHPDGFELEAAAEAQGAVAEEGHGDDGPSKDVQGVDVGHDAAAGLVVVDDGAVDEPFGDQPVGHKSLDDQFVHPAGDVVHLPFAVEPLLARAALLQLGSVRVALPEEVLVAQGRPVHRVLPEESSLRLGHDVVDLLLNEGALLRREDVLLLDAAPHQTGFLLTQVAAVVAVSVVVVVGLPKLALPTFGAAAISRPVLLLVSVRGHGLEFLPQVRVSAGCHVTRNNAAVFSSFDGDANSKLDLSRLHAPRTQ